MNNCKITFIGAGNMARAIIGGLIANGYNPEMIWATNPSLEKLIFLNEKYKINITQNNTDGIIDADIIILSTKPTIIPGICDEIKTFLKKKQPVIISLAVGVTNDLLKKWLNQKVAIVRAMPNIASMVGSGVTGLFANDSTSHEQKNLAESIFRAVGMTLWLDKENNIDLVCAISGSGPAYIFLIMEAIQEAAIKLGLSAEITQLLTTQMVLGASRLALESTENIVELRKAITSPKGTTERAIKILEEGNIRYLFEKTLNAVTERAQEITNSLSSEEQK